MSRSYRKPYTAVTGTKSAHVDKKVAARGLRRRQNQWLYTLSDLEEGLAAAVYRLSGLQRSELRHARRVARKRARSARSSFRRSQRFKPPAQARSARSRQNSTLARFPRPEDMGNGLQCKFKGRWNDREHSRVEVSYQGVFVD